jgi:hypothetical protein
MQKGYMLKVYFYISLSHHSCLFVAYLHDLFRRFRKVADIGYHDQTHVALINLCLLQSAPEGQFVVLFTGKQQSERNAVKSFSS